MPTVTVRKGSLCRVITVEIGTTLLSVIRKAGISVSFPCNGKGSCGKCKVKAIGDLSEFLEKESKWISPSEKEAGVRMACYTTVAGDCEIEVIERSTNAVVENAYTAWEGKLDPLYPDGYGVAFDIGTTTVAAQLFSPAEKRPLSAKGELNRQQTYGADVISRIVSCNTDTVEPQSLLIRRQLSEMIKDLCNGAGISFDEVRYLVVCGNTTMMYILCGIEPAPLSVAPFTMAQPFGGLFDIDLPDFEHLPCWIPECASAYVGADITCSVLASGICNVQKIIDKGVNLAIGTDSVASNNSLNFFEEIKTLVTGTKVISKDPTAVTPKDALRAATYGGAKAQGRLDSGALKEGNKADLIVIDISGPNMHPVHSLINNLVYSCSGGDVLMTIVDGKVLYENGQYSTIDIEKTVDMVEKSTREILERL